MTGSYWKCKVEWVIHFVISKKFLVNITYSVLITTNSQAQKVLFGPLHYYYVCTISPGCQCGSKVISDSPRLVDFVLNLLDGLVMFLGGIT